MKLRFFFNLLHTRTTSDNRRARRSKRKRSPKTATPIKRENAFYIKTSRTKQRDRNESEMATKKTKGEREKNKNKTRNLTNSTAEMKLSTRLDRRNALPHRNSKVGAVLRLVKTLLEFSDPTKTLFSDSTNTLMELVVSTECDAVELLC